MMITNRKTRKRAIRLLTILLSFFIAAGLLPATDHAYAASTRKMTVYNGVIKKGNFAYCVGLGKTFYKVNLKTGKVYDLFTGRIADDVTDRGKSGTPDAFSAIHSMHLKGDYLYYVWSSIQPGTRASLYRIHTKTGSVKRLISTGSGGNLEYAIRGNRIYVKLEKYWFSEKYKYREMKLNGKSVKKTSVRPKMMTAESNVKGYKVKIKYTGSYSDRSKYEISDYLVARNKTILVHRTIGYDPYW